MNYLGYDISLNVNFIPKPNVQGHTKSNMVL